MTRALDTGQFSAFVRWKMDLTNVKAYAAMKGKDARAVAVGPGDQYLGAGTWLYSAPHPAIKRLIDVTEVEPEAEWIQFSSNYVRISAATRLGWLAKYQWPENMRAARVFPLAIEGLSASFKVIQRATVGGNIGLSLAKGAIGPVCVALGADYILKAASGSERSVPAATFQTGSMCNILRPGERVAAVMIPKSNMDADWAIERMRMTTTSHVLTSVIGLKYAEPERFRMSISATLVYPLALDFSEYPESVKTLSKAIDLELPQHPYIEDQHGSARYRHAMARRLAGNVYQKLFSAE